jgi:hydroxysqualene dehydroxylase
MSEIKQHDCIIVGGGWAGLACAVSLVKNRVNPLILEAASQLGGRARSVNFADLVVDNGQHVMLTAYKEVHNLLEYLQVPPQSTSKQLFYLHILNNLKIKLPNLPTPFNLMFGLLLAQGLTINEKYFLVKFALHLHKTKYTVTNDCNTEEYFLKLKTPPRLTEMFFKPLVVSALTTPFNVASSQVFLKVLKRSFVDGHNNSKWVFINTHLSELMPMPAKKYLLHNNINIKNNCRVISIAKQSELFKIKAGTELFFAKKIVLATHPRALLKINFINFPELDYIINKVKKITFQPITTIYYKFAQEIKLPSRIIGVIDCLGDFVFQSTKYNNLLSVVISSTTKRIPREHGILAQTVFVELQCYFSLPEYLDYKVIQEKFAAFTCSSNINSIRPSSTTAVENLFLAGDYTDTQLPATLEGAVQSGLTCANLVLGSVQK